jgi:aromatic ring-opening dioxygenase catalytic subunit (LigB family)
MTTTNKIAEMFNIEQVKKAIANCPQDEIVILCGHWSINQPKYNENEDPETQDWDFQEFEDLLDTTLMVNDYDDLIADPHGIMCD